MSIIKIFLFWVVSLFGWKLVRSNDTKASLQSDLDVNPRRRGSTNSPGRNKEIYKNAKEKGICCRCLKKDVDLDPGYAVCKNCLDYVKKNNKSRYWRLKAAGICVICGKEPAIPNRNKCDVCLEKARAGQRLSVERKKRRDYVPYKRDYEPLPGSTDPYGDMK